MSPSARLYILDKYAGVAQLGEGEPNVQWTFAVRRTTGRRPGRDQPGRNEDRSPSADQLIFLDFCWCSSVGRAADL